MQRPSAKGPVFSNKRRCGSYIEANRDFPGGAVATNLPADAGDTGSSPGPGSSHMPQSN